MFRGLEVGGVTRLLHRVAAEMGGYAENVAGGVDIYAFRQPLGRLRGHHAVQFPRR